MQEDRSTLAREEQPEKAELPIEVQEDISTLVRVLFWKALSPIEVHDAGKITRLIVLTFTNA